MIQSAWIDFVLVYNVSLCESSCQNVSQSTLPFLLQTVLSQLTQTV